MKLKYPLLVALLSIQPIAHAEDLEVITAPCFNCPDLSTIVDATEFNDATYYQDVIQAIANNASTYELHTTLNSVISENHRVLSYSQVWTALTETDEDPSNSDNVILLYRGISIPKFSNGSGSQSNDQDNWNREHTWPKSHGFSSQSNEAYTDIHHLRPTDISVNSARGNLDFDNSDSPLNESPLNRVDSDSFEPRDAVKGDVARMAFYMDTRYNGADVTPDLQILDRLTSVGEPALGRLCRLIEWHNSDPVDAIEQNRNDRIYEFQGNRNPFIDHPEWVDMLFTADACTDTETPTDPTEPDPVEPDPVDPDDGETGTPSNTGTVFISEYIEGSSYNKALELYNPSSNDIDLATQGYTLGRFSNGNTNATTISLSGVIAANSTFVIAHTSANDDIKAVAHLLTGSLSHNGDDAYILYKGDHVVDSFGHVGEDPGSQWGADDFATKDNTLRRNPSVISGDTVFDDAFAPELEWTGFGKDVVSGLGEHTIINPEIFISEYIEGSSYNKALELYNPAGTSVDLSANNYQLARFTNGSTTGAFIDLTGVIAGGDVFVIANSAAADEILNVADQLSGNISHNGDDGYVLYKDGIVIDSLGTVGEDPGSEWGTDLQSTKDNTLVRNSAVTAGDIITDDAFNPALEWEGYAKDTFDNLGSHNASGSTEPDVLEIGACLEPATLISSIQGNSTASPLLDEVHIIEGVVTGVFSELGGYFVQEQLADEDGDATTSEGIFVANNEETYPTEGSIVRVVGGVTESYNKTQLVATDALFDCGTDTVSATLLSLPFENTDAPEALEGMLVTLSDELMVSDNYSLGQYGEVTLSNGRLFNPTNLFLPNSDEAIALAEANTLNKIILDDNVNGTNPENVIYPTGGLLASNTLRVGDSVSSLTGIMDYSFSAYRVLPTIDPVFVQTNPRSQSPELVAGNLTIASINVLNLFNGDGLGEGFPTSRGADSLVEYERQLAKTISALIAMDADIVGLMEIENDGFEETSTIVELVTKLNQALGESIYAYVDAAAPIGTDQIAVGLIYKIETVTPNGAVLLNTDSIFNRPPLAQTFNVIGSDEKITVIVNHFKSKGCGSATGGDADQGDGQSCYNQKRTAQAQMLMQWISTDTQLSAQENMLVMGDLNAYAKEDPITAFTDNGYINIIEEFAGAEAYSYVYQGLFGYLDHALVSSALADKVVDAGEWHINADEPRVLDYNVEYKSDTQINDFYADDAYRMSDHDPVVVSLFFEPSPIPNVLGDWDGDKDVDWKDIFKFFVAIYKQQEIDMAFDLNNDNKINLRDVKVMGTLCTYRGCRVVKDKKSHHKRHRHQGGHRKDHRSHQDSKRHGW